MRTTHSMRFCLFIIGLLFIVFLAGCNMPGAGIQDKGLMATLARQTVSARLTQAILETQNASGWTPAVTRTATPEGTATPANTTMPQPTNTAWLAPTDAPIPCNWAQFIDDVTIPDNTELIAGAIFTKTWRIKNIGVCDWTSGYRLIFDGGDPMNAPGASQFTSGTVPAGATVDISVQLTAPSSPGAYTGYYKLRSPDNIVFGTGAGAYGNFWVKIVVLAPSATPTTTATPTMTSTSLPTATLTNTPLPTATHTTAPAPIATDTPSPTATPTTP